MWEGADADSLEGLITSSASNIHLVHCFHQIIMAAPSITSTFFMLASPSSWNSTNKSKICSQRLKSSSNTNGKTVKLIQDSCLKIKSHAQPVLNDENRVTSMIESLEDEEIMTSPPCMNYSFNVLLLHEYMIYRN